MSDLKMFRKAMVHKSVTKRAGERLLNNERLEYLGDAVLDLLVAEILYKRFQDRDEGYMSAMRSYLVSRKSLNAISMSMGFLEVIQYKGQRPVRETHVPGDTLEAFVGAIYLDGGIGKAKKFVRRYVASDAIIDEAMKEYMDFKSLVLQWGQKNKSTIVIDTQEKCRTDDGTFIFVSKILNEEGVVLGEGEGTTKKNAEQSASQKALEALNSEKC